MFRRNPASLIRKIDCRVLSFSRRLRGLAYTQQLFRAIRVIGPTLVALSFAGVAHAQGTMDFSGATTLMGSRNLVCSRYVELTALHEQHKRFAIEWDNNLRLQGFSRILIRSSSGPADPLLPKQMQNF